MAENKKSKIFLSYAWANTDLVDEIEADLKELGIVLTRDVRDLGYRRGIKDFMHTIGKHDFVLMLISDEYLRSENCMYEVTELLGTHEFKERILPIVHDNARHIFDSMGSAIYFDYWKSKKQQATAFNKKNANQVSVDALRKITNIHNLIDVFFTQLTDLNVYSLAQLQFQNYRSLVAVIENEDQAEVEYWQRIIDSTSISDFENYQSMFPEGKHFSEAKAKVLGIKAKEFEEQEKKKAQIVKENRERQEKEELEKKRIEFESKQHIDRERSEWDKIKHSQKKSDFEKYISDYPDGIFTKDAKGRLLWFIKVDERTSSEIAEFKKQERRLAARKRMRRVYYQAVLICLLMLFGIAVIAFFVSGGYNENKYDSSKADSAKMDTTLRKSDTTKAVADTSKKIALQNTRSGSKYLLVDNFDDNRNHWYLVDNSLYHSFIKDNKLTVDVRDKELGYCFSVASSVNIDKDFTFSCKIRWVNGSDSSGVGLAFGRSLGSDNKPYYVFLITADGSFQVSSFSNSKWKDLMDWEDSSHIKKLENENEIKIIKKDGIAYFYINGFLVKSLQNMLFYGNYFGLDITDRMKVQFSDLRLEGTYL